MIVELIGTWLIVGFFTAVGWGVAQKTVVEPYVNPVLEKQFPVDKKEEPKKNEQN